MRLEYGREMDRPDQALAPGAPQVVEVSFDAAGWELLEREAARLGVIVAQYVHDAALGRAGERRANEHRVVDAAARRAIDEAAAMRAESRQVQRRAAELRCETNAILDTVVLMVTDLLRRRGFPLRAPVMAKFLESAGGNTGVEVAVRLGDPRQAGAAEAAIVERFPDHLSEVMVS